MNKELYSFLALVNMLFYHTEVSVVLLVLYLFIVEKYFILIITYQKKIDGMVKDYFV